MKREENEQMRDTILNAVIACKIDAAGADVSLSQISCRAGISERTLNRYYPDKEILLYDAAILYLRQIYYTCADRYNKLDKTGMNGLQRLMLLIKMQIELNQTELKCAKVFVRAYTTALRTAVYRDLPVSGCDAPVRDIVLNCIEDGVSDGSIRPDIVPIDTYMLISSNYMGLVQRLIYCYSVELTKEEHKNQLLLVFNKYLQMLEEYLCITGRSVNSISEK